MISSMQPSAPSTSVPHHIDEIAQRTRREAVKIINTSDRWFFDKEKFDQTPSRKHGIDTDKELTYRQQAANFIQDIGQRLQVNQLCINTAIVYMHRFYMYHSFTHFHRNSISTASIFLAAKVEEQPRKLEHVIRVAHYNLLRDNTPFDPKSEHYGEQASDLVMNENILLQTLGFDVGIDHPHTHVVKCCQLVRASKDLAQTSYLMATNSLHLTTMCLQYKPTVVACVCIHLACKWSNWEIPRSKEGKDWFWYVDESVTSELLERLTTEFLEVFNKSPSRLKKKIMSLSQQSSSSGSLPLSIGTFPNHMGSNAALRSPVKRPPAQKPTNQSVSTLPKSTKYSGNNHVPVHPLKPGANHHPLPPPSSVNHMNTKHPSGQNSVPKAIPSHGPKGSSGGHSLAVGGIGHHSGSSTSHYDSSNKAPDSSNRPYQMTKPHHDQSIKVRVEGDKTNSDSISKPHHDSARKAHHPSLYKSHHESLAKQRLDGKYIGHHEGAQKQLNVPVTDPSHKAHHDGVQKQHHFPSTHHESSHKNHHDFAQKSHRENAPQKAYHSAQKYPPDVHPRYPHDNNQRGHHSSDPSRQMSKEAGLGSSIEDWMKREEHKTQMEARDTKISPKDNNTMMNETFDTGELPLSNYHHKTPLDIPLPQHTKPMGSGAFIHSHSAKEQSLPKDSMRLKDQRNHTYGGGAHGLGASHPYQKPSINSSATLTAHTSNSSGQPKHSMQQNNHNIDPSISSSMPDIFNPNSSSKASNPSSSFFNAGSKVESRSFTSTKMKVEGNANPNNISITGSKAVKNDGLMGNSSQSKVPHEAFATNVSSQKGRAEASLVESNILKNNNDDPFSKQSLADPFFSGFDFKSEPELSYKNNKPLLPPLMEKFPSGDKSMKDPTLNDIPVSMNCLLTNSKTDSVDSANTGVTQSITGGSSSFSSFSSSAMLTPTSSFPQWQCFQVETVDVGNAGKETEIHSSKAKKKKEKHKHKDKTKDREEKKHKKDKYRDKEEKKHKKDKHKDKDKGTEVAARNEDTSNIKIKIKLPSDDKQRRRRSITKHSH